MSATDALEWLDGHQRLLDRTRRGGLAHGVGQREQVVGGRTLRVVLGEPEHLPAAGCAESLAVLHHRS